jgi:putative Mn2+ efflux pump MntP
MEGYGRWITLAIFIIVICWAIYNGLKEDKEEMKIVLKYLFISVIGLALISFISHIW